MSGLVQTGRGALPSGGSGKDAQRTHARKVPVVGHKRRSIDRERACRLHRVGEFQPQRRPESRSAFGDADVERDGPPCFEDRAIALGERVIAGAERARQDLCAPSDPPPPERLALS